MASKVRTAGLTDRVLFLVLATARTAGTALPHHSLAALVEDSSAFSTPKKRASGVTSASHLDVPGPRTEPREAVFCQQLAPPHAALQFSWKVRQDIEPVSPMPTDMSHVTLCQCCLTAYRTSSLSSEQLKQEPRPELTLAGLLTEGE